MIFAASKRIKFVIVWKGERDKEYKWINVSVLFLFYYFFLFLLQSLSFVFIFTLCFCVAVFLCYVWLKKTFFVASCFYDCPVTVLCPVSECFEQVFLVALFSNIFIIFYCNTKKILLTLESKSWRMS